MDGVGGTGQPTRPNSFTNLGHNLVGVNQLQQKMIMKLLPIISGSYNYSESIISYNYPSENIIHTETLK